MTSARVFLIGGVLSYRALFGWMSPWVFIPSLVVAPIFQILLFVYIGRSAGLESDEFYVIGNAIQYAAIPCLFAMTQLIAGERFQQTLGYILITPAKRLPLFLGRALPVVLNGFMVSAFAFLVGSAVVGLELPASSYAPIALVTLVSAFSCTGLGLVNAGLGFVVRETAVRRLADGASLGDVWGLVAAEALIGVVYGAAGYALVRAAEVAGRRFATIDRA